MPSRPVWIDTRFELYPPEQWEKYKAIAGASAQWESLLEEEKIQLVMLSTSGEPMLVSAMKDSTQWCEKYRDEDSVIFSRGTGGCQ
jgi:wyosine [tRNA(Phe)-imidazoG37] synthetase (radical SAM superfamily)